MSSDWEGKNIQPLTACELERLAFLAEECSEVIKEAMKIIRFGYEDTHPAVGMRKNRVRLAEEMGQLSYVMDLMIKRDDIDRVPYRAGRVQKYVRLTQYALYQSVLPPEKL